MEKNGSIISHLEWFIVFITLIGGFYAIDVKFDAKFDSINSRFDQFIFAWQQESKDFHGRLCQIEEKNKGK